MSYFLDTSALVKIYHREAGTDTVLALYRSAGELVIAARTGKARMNPGRRRLLLKGLA